METTPGEADRPDLRAARVVALGLVVSKPSGYVRDALLAARFGTGRAMDAYTLAATVATAAFEVVGTPLQKVLVPILVRARGERGQAGLERTAGAVFWVAALACLAAGMVVLAAAGPLAGALAGEGRLASATAGLLRWLSPLPLAMCVSAYATGWLQAHERFTLPAFVGLPLDAAIIGLVLFAPTHGPLAAAWGLVIGYAAQFALQWFGLRRHGHRLRRPAPAAALRDPGLRVTLRLALPVLVSVAAAQAGTLLQQSLAARLQVGSVAALGYAFRVLDVPSALFILPVVTVALPRFAALVTAGREAEAGSALVETAWVLAAALVPPSLLFALLARPLSAALYEHGAFGAASVTAMAAALTGFAPGVLLSGMQQLLRAYFYARADARTPMGWDLAALAATAAFDVAAYRAWGPAALAVGWTLGSGVGWVGMSLAAGAGRSRTGPRAAVPLAAAGAALVAVVWALHGRVPPWLGAAPWRAGLSDVVVVGAAGLAAYAAVLLATGGRPLLEGLAGRFRSTARHG